MVENGVTSWYGGWTVEKIYADQECWANMLPGGMNSTRNVCSQNFSLSGLKGDMLYIDKKKKKKKKLLAREERNWLSYLCICTYTVSGMIIMYIAIELMKTMN